MQFPDPFVIPSQDRWLFSQQFLQECWLYSAGLLPTILPGRAQLSLARYLNNRHNGSLDGPDGAYLSRMSRSFSFSPVVLKYMHVWTL